jgi:ATP-dependent Clp protease adaptor protein ClpS
MSGISHEWDQDYDGVIVMDRDEEKQEVKPPKKYHVFILNDDYSTFELVIDVCTRFFGQTEDQAQRTAQDVHTKGKGLAGTYSKDIAETKAHVMNDFAQEREMPLMATVEEE